MPLLILKMKEKRQRGSLQESSPRSIQWREEGQQMGQREGSGGPPGSGVTAAGTESWEGSALQGAGRGPSYPAAQGPVGSGGFM